jgi:DNA processing protein
MEPIHRAVTAWHVWQTPAVILRALRVEGSSAVDAAWDALSTEARDELITLGDHMAEAGVNALLYGADDYPDALTRLKSPSPVLFYAGNPKLLDRPAVGVCGSRAASAQGLEAAGALGRSLAEDGQVTIAGNAQGVDEEAQGSALAAGGGVITVIPEGISHFRLRTGAHDPTYAEEQLLVLSQFPPRQPWSVGGAMTRNALIGALSTALVVIEASDRGGTLAAGEAGLKLGRPVIALEYGSGTPPGNALLIRKGARAARTPRELRALLDETTLASSSPAALEQLPLSL